MEQERERKDFRETNYQKDHSDSYEEEEQYRSKEIINLGDLMSAKRNKQRQYGGDMYEREGFEASPQLEQDFKAEVSFDQASYLKAKEREEIMKRLVSSQETYIKELEGKVTDLEDLIEQKNQDVSTVAAGDWQKEKQILQDLVKKNQSMSEDLEYKMRKKEDEFQELLAQREQMSTVEKTVLESENRVLKELQNQKMTCEKDRIQFHKTLRNMLLEEIERIESSQRAKEEDMEKWRENFESDMSKEQDRLNSNIDNLTQERNILQSQLQASMGSFQKKEKELEQRI